MEIALVSEESIRVKGKQTALVIDPLAAKAKIAADAVLLTQENGTAVPAVEGSRITIAGPGEYEIGGIKISGVRTGERTAYYASIDGLSVAVCAASALKNKESLRDVDIALLYADALVDQSALATVANGVAVFYGPQALENVKALGKDVPPIGKYVTTKDKLPQELEIVLLG